MHYGQPSPSCLLLRVPTQHTPSTIPAKCTAPATLSCSLFFQPCSRCLGGRNPPHGAQELLFETASVLTVTAEIHTKVMLPTNRPGHGARAKGFFHFALWMICLRQHFCFFPGTWQKPSLPSSMHSLCCCAQVMPRDGILIACPSVCNF